jgi:uncharacterized membrane protein YphA (DoxX/SURF4 family)
VQRLFSAFPGRGPGAGLLLLRVAVGIVVIAEGSIVLSARGSALGLLIAVALILVGTMLTVGVLTPFAGLLAALMSALGGTPWLALSSATSVDDWVGRLFFVIVSLAIALLGPGAFSLDAYLFGRREIVIPRQSPAERSL